MIFSCGKNKESKNEAEIINKYKDLKYALMQAKKTVGDYLQFAYSGKFKDSAGIEVIAGSELSKSNEIGIKFYLLRINGNILEKSYQTKLLNGSFQHSIIQKIKFPWFNYELLYYNSQDYFMGSSGGEIISYIINFNSKEIYYAHLVVQNNMPVSLYLSPNIKMVQLRKFFIGNFKRDFPKLVLINNDININN